MDVVTSLAASWPPDVSLAGSRLLDVVALDPSNGLVIAVARQADGQLAAAPVIRDGQSWRRAVAGDGAAAALCAKLQTHPPVPQERPITADQTNESVIVGDGPGSTIVKWIRNPSRDHPAPLLLAHLAEVGFRGVPKSYGRLTWQAADGAELVLAFLDAYLEGSQDGWDWCVDDLLAHLTDGKDADFACQLGRLVADLHVALATPSSVQPDPISQGTAADALSWLQAAESSLDEALSCTPGSDGEDLRRSLPLMQTALQEIGATRSTPLLRIHGDLHVGQVLRWSGGLAVIDFDGNPTLPASVVMAPAPLARDVAQMLRSLDHVARIANRRTEGNHAADVERWVARSRNDFLAQYRKGLVDAGISHLFDERLLVPFEVEQECRELIYAARFLPRWRYAPMAALRAMFPESFPDPS